MKTVIDKTTGMEVVPAGIAIEYLIVAEAVEIAQAIYTGDTQTLNGWADWFCDAAAEALAAHGCDSSFISDAILSDN